MKKALKTVLIVLLILIIATGALAVWQWKNIEGVLIGVSQNSEEIKKRRNDNQASLVGDVNSYMDTPLRELTEEEQQQIANGETSASDVYMRIFEEKEAEMAAKQAEKAAENAAKKDEIVSRYMAQMYKLQSEFSSRAEATISQGASYYNSLSTKRHDPIAKANTIKHFTPIVKGIENECNAKVEKVIANMKKELEAIDADTSITKTVRETYEKEKQLKLSYYSNKYLK